VVPEGSLVRRLPKAPDDVGGVEKYVAALDDPSLPLAEMRWEGRNRIRIRASAAHGQAVSVQVSYHAGWHASVAGQPRAIYKDGLGLMWLRPECGGPCEILLDYDGGWELRLCRIVSYAALAGLVLIPLVWHKRQFRAKRN
jgi:hypothetical protein